LNKAYMVALRTSVMSLYEVSDVVPGESLLARDLVRGGDSIRVSERTATRQLRQWDRIGARVVPLGSKNVMSGGVLPFGHDVADECLRRLRAGLEKVRTRSAEALHGLVRDLETANLGELLRDNEILRCAAPLFTNVWLGDVLHRVLHPPVLELRNRDDDELVFTTVRYPLAPEATADAVRAALGKLGRASPERRHLLDVGRGWSADEAGIGGYRCGPRNHDLRR
jgi:hypothetical protein